MVNDKYRLMWYKLLYRLGIDTYDKIEAIWDKDYSEWIDVTLEFNPTSVHTSKQMFTMFNLAKSGIDPNNLWTAVSATEYKFTVHRKNYAAVLELYTKFRYKRKKNDRR